MKTIKIRIHESRTYLLKDDVLGLINELKFSNGCKCANCKSNRSSYVVDAEEIKARIKG